MKAFLLILVLFCLPQSLCAAYVGPNSLDARIWESMDLAARGRFEEALVRIRNLRSSHLLARGKLDYFLLRILVQSLEAGEPHENGLKEVLHLLASLKKTWNRRLSGQEEGDQYTLGIAALEERVKILKKVEYKSLLSAVKEAHKVWGKKKHECYWTAVATSRRNGANGKTHWEWKADLSYRFKSLATIPDAIEKGILKPGMVIYANKKPGTDPRSSNLANKPHWFTYLGRGHDGKPMFSDQYFVSTDFTKMKRWIAGRRIDAFYDPYFR